MKPITGATLQKLFPTLKRDKAERYAADYSAALKFGEINSRARLCAFVAQQGLESSDLKHLREIWGPTPAQARYDVRTDLGNTPERDGDGKKYMGRGGLQRTGKANYLRFQEATGVPVVDHPELIEKPEHSFASDALYWKDKKLNRLADQLTLCGDAKDLAIFDKITKKINGGYNHRIERQSRYLVAIANIPEDLFNPHTEVTPAAVEKSALDRVNEHVNVATPAPPVSQNPPPSDESEKDATTKILIEKLSKKEGTKAAARSIGRRLAEPFALLLTALGAGNVYAWIGTVVFVGVLGFILYRERHAIAGKFQSLKKTITDLL